MSENGTLVDVAGANEQATANIMEARRDEVRRDRENDTALTKELQTLYDGISSRPGPPPMPPAPESATAEQALEIAAQWSTLPLAERKRTAESYAEIKAFKDYGLAHDMKVESAADVAAIRSLMGKDKSEVAPSQAPAAASKLWSEGLGFDVKTDAEGIEQFSGIVKEIQEKGAAGWRSIMQRYGVHPAQLLNDYESAQIAAARAGHGLPDENYLRAEAVISEWSEGREDFDDLLDDMQKLIESGKFSQEKSKLKLLDRAYQEAKRGKKRATASGRLDKMDDDLREIAKRAFAG